LRQYESNGNAHDLLGRAYLALGDFNNAAQEFDVALSHGNRDSWDKRAMVDAAERRFDRADGWLRRAPPDAGPEVDYYRALFSIDQRQWTDARHSARQALEESGKAPSLYRLSLEYALAVAESLDGGSQSARMRSARLVDESVAILRHASPADAQEVAGIALSAALLSQRLGDKATVDKVVAADLVKAPLDLPDLVELQTVLRAGRSTRQGNPSGAVDALKPLLTGHERFQTHVALFDAYQALGQGAEAAAQARWLMAHRGLAYGELGCYGCQKTLNVADLGRAQSYLQQLARPQRS
jgi:tetratricopeptide (TPR) repeat protein